MYNTPSCSRTCRLLTPDAAAASVSSLYLACSAIVLSLIGYFEIFNPEASTFFGFNPSSDIFSLFQSAAFNSPETAITPSFTVVVTDGKSLVASFTPFASGSSGVIVTGAAVGGGATVTLF